jgi:2-polyprenyl-3-methyl-5-hydroxy-6-metoxy-1,4-benzoquinol methylase
VNDAPSSLRQLGRQIRRVPVVGEPLKGVYAWLEDRLWRHLLIPLRERRLAAGRWLTDLRNARARTAANVTRRNTREAYERLYADPVLLAEYRTAARLAFYDRIAERAAALQPESIVDVGCGPGDLLRRIVDRTGVSDVLGIDHAQAAVREARALVPESEFVTADIETYESARAFDLVVCTEVLEHLRRPAAGRDLLGRLARPGGSILVTVPDGDADDWEGHENFWNAGELAAFLAALGSVEVTVDGGDLIALVSAPPRA